MNEIENLRRTLDLAKSMTLERLALSPGYGAYQHALDQIEFIERILHDTATPSNEQKDAVDIALMAVKEFDDSDPKYSDALCELSYLYKKL